jgi:hypothetical protein
VNSIAPITLDERLDQIKPLSDTIIRDVGECANLDRVPENILMRARGCIWLAMTYELFSLYEPESINIPMLTRLTSSNMQGFFCPCAWNVVYDTELNCLTHMKTKHPTVQRALLVVRRSTDPYEYD